ncbi:MAG: OmpH family outer membrane protein [Desulfobacterales bacterium]
MYTVKAVRWAFITSLITLLAAASGYGADVAKIGIIDSQKVLMDSDAGKEVQAQINTSGKEMEGKLKELGAEIEELKQKLERESMVMTKELRDEKEREIRIKINDFKVQQNKYRQELQGLEKEHLGRIRKEILEIAQEIGKKGNYLMIMENVGVLYSPSSIDITDELIKKYNAAYKGKAKKN